MIDAGVLSLRIAPVTTNFWRETDTKLRSQKAPKAEVNVEANIRKASQEIAMFRMREQANAINLKVKVDEKSIRTANEKIRYIEHTWKQSDIKRAIRVQVFVAGAAALPALTQGIVALTASMTELGRVALGLPGLLAGVGAAASTLLTGIQGVGAALKAAAGGMDNSAQSARQFAQASRQLSDAQRDVVQALKRANREIEDQKDKLADGRLSVEQAQINIRRANEALARGGFKSLTDYQQAVLDVRRANQDLATTLKENRRNIQDYYEQAGRGATESNTFRDSLDGLADSVDRYTKAQLEAAGMSEQFISAMKNLAPAGQQFVLQMLQMRGAWRGFRDSVQTTFFNGLGDSITNLVQKQLPILKTGMQQVAAGLNASFKAIFASLGRDANTSAIAEIFESTGRALRAATPGLDSFINGMLKLSEVGSRFLPRLALAFNKVMDRFETFINRADKDGSLNRWIDSGLNLLSSLGRSLLSIGSILGSITEAYNKATGNVGGFASTLERALGRWAATMSSPAGQTRLISWMRTSRDFMKTISDALPGIQKIFAAIGDGARKFAEAVFPVFSSLGKVIGDNNGLVSNLVRLYLIFRTLAPVWSSATKGMNAFNAAVQKYNENAAKRLSSREASRAALVEAQGARFAAKDRLDTLRLELRSSDKQLQKARERRRNAQFDLDYYKKIRVEAEKSAKAAEKAAGSPIIVPGQGKGTQSQDHLAKAKAYEKAKAQEAAALAKFNRAEGDYTKAYVARSGLQFEAQNKMPKAMRDYRMATDLAAQAGENFSKTNRLAADGIGGKWARTVDRTKGKLGELRGAFRLVATSILSVAGSFGLVYGFDQLTAAQDRNRSSADKLKESQDALAQTLNKGTGSATAATLEENSRQLRDRVNPVHADDPGQNFNAAKTLERQLGIPLSEAVTLTLPTEVKKREARLAPADAKVIAAVPELQEWKQWGEKYQANGVTKEVYGKALNGDPESIGKVEAARRAIKDSSALGRGMNMGVAANTGYAPDDLGAAQEQLPRTGATMQLSNGQEVPGGLRALSLAAGAARGVGNDALRVGQQAQENANLIPQFGLNQKGRRAFGPFVIGAAGALMNPDGSAVIEVDRYPDDVVKGWIDGASDKGISVERRFPSGAVITIDPQFAKEYFKASATEYARGGSVWGAGTATSDSIPAMLSNGEFVINAKSASMIGHDNLKSLNSIGKFAAGGPVLKLAPGGPAGDGESQVDRELGFFGGIFDWFKNNVFYPEPDPVAAGERQGVPTALPALSTPVDSSPVTTPLSPSDIAATLGGPSGAIYIPRLGGSGALPEIRSRSGGAGTGASMSPNAPINPDANILDYLVQVGNSWGLAVGSGPPNQELADELGIWTHSDDGGQHSVNRALDLGNSEQAQAGLISNFARAWMADPEKVAATRQLIHQDPTTGEVFAIYAGRALYGQEAWDVFGGDFSSHRAHAHLALEGVPSEMFGANGAGVPMNMPKSGGGSTSSRTGSSDPQAYGDLSGIGAPAAPAPAPAGPAASAPGVPTGPAVAAPPPVSAGPAAEVPIDPINFLKQIGAAILKGIFGFFGIDASAFVDNLFGLIPGGNQDGANSAVDEAAAIPEPDPLLVDQMDQQIEAAKAQKTTAGDALAKSLEEGKNDYLKQFSDANVRSSAEDLAKYYDSIGDPQTATKLRENAGLIAKTTPPPGPAPKPQDQTDPAKPPTLTVAPSANYSGGNQETWNAVYRAFTEAGYEDSEWPALVNLLNNENDTWDPKRPTGGPNSDASGIFQFLSTTWDTVGMEYSEDPYIQGVAGMRYIKQRYGTPTAAWEFWQNPSPPGPPGWPHWYSIGGLVQHLAAGGMVTGPGTGTSDSIPAMLSNGEFVMRADAVKSIGADRLHAMNRFAPGGLVGSAINPMPLPDQQEPDWRVGLEQTLADAGIYGSADPSQGTASATNVVPKYDPGPLTNIADSSFKQGVTDFGDGVSRAVESNITGLVETVKNPGQALVGLGSLAPMPEDLRRGIFGEDVTQLGDLYKGIAKDLVKADEWKDNPLGALGGIAGELGAVATGGAARGAKLASEAAAVNRSLKGIDLTELKLLPRSVRKDVKQSLSDLTAFAPGANLESVRVAPQSELGEGTYAMTAAVRPVISLSQELFGNPKALRDFYSNDVARGFHNPLGKKTDSAVRAIIAHEYAHILRLHGDAAGLSYDDFSQQFVDRAAAYLGAIRPELGARGIGRTPEGYAGVFDKGPSYGAVGEWSYALTNFLRNSLSGYSYEPVYDRITDPDGTGRRLWESVPQREVTRRMLSELGTSFDDIPELGPMRALGSIDMEEALAEGFGDVFMRGDQAKPGSIMMYRILSDQIEKATKDFGGGPLPRVEYPLAPGLDSRMSPRPIPDNTSARIYANWAESKGLDPFNLDNAETFVAGYGEASDAKGIYEWIKDYLPDRGLASRAFGAPPRLSKNGPGMSWDNFAEWAGSYYPFAVEEGLQGWDASRLGGKPPLGSPFSTEQLIALSDYSGSSSANKTMRGKENLPMMTGILQELLDLGPQMSGVGGKTPNYSPGKIMAMAGGLTKDSGYSVEQAMGALAREFPLATTQQLWEIWFVEHLRASRSRASQVLSNLDQADIIRSAFDRVPPVPEDVWVTRMIDDFGTPLGNDFDPESLVGETVATNRGFSSTSGGFTNKPRSGAGYSWQHRAGRGISGAANPFQGRPIMQQIFVPAGTPGIWFGGGENELVLPDNMSYTVDDQMNILDAAGLDDAEISRVLEAERIMQERVGEAGGNRPPSYRQMFRTYGEAKFDNSLPKVTANDLGFNELDKIMRELGDPGDGYGPAWMDLLGPKRLSGYMPDWSPFDIPPVFGLNYANGGYISGPGGPKSDMIPAMLSNGEFVMSAAATKHWGADRLASMNAIPKFNAGGLVALPFLTPPPVTAPPPPPPPKPNQPPPAPPPPTGSSDPQAFTDLSKPPAPATGSSDPQAFTDLEKTVAADAAGLKALSGLGGAGPKLGGGGGTRSPAPKDPRSRLAPAPTGASRVNPALSAGIKGAFNTVGSLAGTAASLAMAGGTMGASAAMPGAGQAVGSIIQAGTQLAGDLAVGGANILSSLLVGTVTPAETGQGYGAPLLPQQQMQRQTSNFQSIHNGNIVTNNLSEYSRLKDRKDAQKSAPFFNRVNS